MPNKMPAWPANPTMQASSHKAGGRGFPSPNLHLIIGPTIGIPGSIDIRVYARRILQLQMGLCEVAHHLVQCRFVVRILGLWRSIVVGRAFGFSHGRRHRAIIMGEKSNVYRSPHAASVF